MTVRPTVCSTSKQLLVFDTAPHNTSASVKWILKSLIICYNLSASRLSSSLWLAGYFSIQTPSGPKRDFLDLMVLPNVLLWPKMLQHVVYTELGSNYQPTSLETTTLTHATVSPKDIKGWTGTWLNLSYHSHCVELCFILCLWLFL